ncbi:hypothetical protein [Prochlorothrix hollandica]|uniref:Gas vesicle protein GvpC n=1 Tax=Prochlorothrix hollandica PCC 9006 = CALU 1027 TaxID=317619 RepID=A0A0M2PY37_PROHO|nr:hypothetical protein [Prochlorothrix hollandica]KKI99301.1 hypothetical protein PROH_16395 [Prochlorothrix hollandica PCC 9006 = CALU 1027]
MTSLQAQWRAAQQQRQQELANRAQAVRNRLSNLTMERDHNTQALRQNLTQFRDELALEGDLFKEQCQHQDQQRRMAVTTQLQGFLDDRQQQAQETRQNLAEFRQDLAQQQAELLQAAQVADRSRHQTAQARHRQTQAQVAHLHADRQQQEQNLRQDLHNFRHHLAQVHNADTQYRQAVHGAIAQSTQAFLQEAQQLRQIQAEEQRQSLQEHRASISTHVWGTPESLPKAAAPRRPLSSPPRPAAVPGPAAVPRPAPVAIAAPTPAPVAVAAPTPAAPAAPNTQDQVYNYLKQHPGQRLADLDVPLGLTRVQVGDALRELTKQGKITQQDRAYFVQETPNS